MTLTFLGITTVGVQKLFSKWTMIFFFPWRNDQHYDEYDIFFGVSDLLFISFWPNCDFVCFCLFAAMYFSLTFPLLLLVIKGRFQCEL